MSAPTFDNLLGGMVMHAHAGVPLAPIENTRQNILAMSPASEVFARSTDYNDLFYWNGGAWLQVPFPFVTANANPDMGVFQDSSPIGVHKDYIDSKLLSRVQIGSVKREQDGGVIYDASASSGAGFFGRVAAVWVKFVTNFVFRELLGRLQWKPENSSEYYDVARLNSTAVGLNGLPLVQDGQVSMGAYPDPLILDGGNAAMSNSATPTLLLHGTIFRMRVRRMTDAERTALVAGQHMEGELVYATDTKKLYISDGAGTLTALN